MKTIKLPTGGNIVHLGDDASAAKQERFFNARYKFSQTYATGQGWDINNLSIKQLLEIRDQQGWKTPITENA